jgi:hypothetical protein
MEGLLTMLLSDRFGPLAGEAEKAPRSAEAEEMRAQIRQDMQKKIKPEKAEGKKD